jgi:hypothetical protein
MDAERPRRAVVEVPGYPRLSRAAPPRTIALPLHVASRWNGLALLGGVIGAFLLAGALMVFAAAPRRGETISDAAILLLMGPFTAALGTCFVAAAVTSVCDVMRRQPALIIDTEGFFDRRSMRCPISWSDILSATIVFQSAITQTGIIAVRLRLRMPVRSVHNPFRLGMLGFQWRKKPDELYVPLVSLSAEPHSVAHVILILAQD